MVAHNFEFDAHMLTLLLENAGFEVVASDDLIRSLARKVREPRRELSGVSKAREGWYERNREYLLELERDRARWAPVYRAWDTAKAPLGRSSEVY